MKRRSVLFIALACLAVLALAVAPWNVASDPVAREIGSHVKALTGLRLVVKGRATVAFLPIPRIKLEDVTLVAPGGETLIEASQLRGGLNFMPLLRGNIELSDATLLQPDIDLRDALGEHSPWARTRNLIRREIETGRNESGRAHIGRLVIVDGTVRLTGEGYGQALNDVNLLINWSGPSRAMAAAGSLVWRGEKTDISLSGLNPARLMAGNASDLVFSAKHDAGELAFSGQVMGGPEFQVSGNATLKASDLRRLDYWLDTKLPGASRIGAFRLEGPLSANDRSFSFASATVTLGQDHLDGALTGKIENGHLSLSGTFAADTLDLTPFADPFIPAVTSYGTWTTHPLDLSRIAGADLDLRISATKAQIGRVALGEIGAGILLRGGRLEALISRARFYGGAGRARLIVTPAEGGLEAKAQVSAEKVSLANALADLGWARKASGTAAAQINVETSGASFADLMRRMTGKATLYVKQGEVTGLNLGEAARLMGSRPLSIPLDWKSGHTIFEQMSGTAAIADGIAELTGGSLTGTNYNASLTGQIGLRDRSLHLKGNVVGAGGMPEKGLPFEVVGGWDDPALNLDVQALIKRSGAVVPLLGVTRAVTIDPGQ